MARYTKSETAARKTARATLEDPDASIQSKYHAQLMLRSTRKDAEARTAKNAQRPETPAPTQHRIEPPDDENTKKVRSFLAAVDRMLQNKEDEMGSARAEAEQPGDPTNGAVSTRAQ